MVDLSFSQTELERRVGRITAFIETQVQQAGVEGVVLGLSGGVDSSTTAALAARALEPDRVAPLILPAEPTRSRSIEYAHAVADTFDLEPRVVDVEPIVEAFRDAHNEPVSRTTLGNVRARTRAVYWYLVANEEDRLVLGGGNRTEWLVGYFTKYGDAAVDCLPLGNLYKAQVRQVGAHLGVPDDVVTRAPSAELWVDQTDEGELGIEYDTLDAILALYVDGEHTRDEVVETLDVAPELVDRVEGLVAASQHKRRLPPTPP